MKEFKKNYNLPTIQKEIKVTFNYNNRNSEFEVFSSTSLPISITTISGQIMFTETGMTVNEGDFRYKAAMMNDMLFVIDQIKKDLEEFKYSV